MKKELELGTYYSYPKCCIESFYKTFGAIYNPIEAKAGNGTGFIPCPACAKRVLLGHVTLDELITNRQHNAKFPKDLSDKELDKLF